MSDLISRQEAIEAALTFIVEYCGAAFDEDMQKTLCERFDALLSAEPEIIQCKDCIYYDPPHIEKDGQRYEYKDMPPEAFDPFTKKYVNISYGINIGGRCCRDYECGYSEDKRVYIPETNYCGRAERKEE